MKILGTGMTGLVGSRTIDLLSDQYEFENISRSTGVDISNKEQVVKAVSDSDAEVVLHLAAKADVDGCEKDHDEDIKILGYKDIKRQQEEWSKNPTAWSINVEGTRNVAEACEKAGKKLIYISTDFVFDGEYSPLKGYTEESKTNPLNWYAQTKYEGEKIVEDLQSPWMILRIAYPYRADFPKNDFVRAVLKRLQNNQPVTMVSDHMFTPTLIDDFANALHRLLMQNVSGLFHVVGDSSMSPFEAALKIAKIFDLDSTLIGSTTRAEFFKDRAIRPFRLTIENDKIEQLGVQMRTFDEGLTELRSQLKS